jgi:hypothetical protein
MGEFVFLLFLGLMMAALPEFVAAELMTAAGALQRFKQYLNGRSAGRFLLESGPELPRLSGGARFAMRCFGMAIAGLAFAGLAGLGR